MFDKKLRISYDGSVLRVLPVTLLVVLAGFIGQARAAMRPNFVVFQTDDQSLSMTQQPFLDQRGKRQWAMPFWKSIAAQGTLFGNYMAASPICAPSRASFLSGQHPHNHEVLYNDSLGGGLRGGWPAWRASSSYEDNFVVRLQSAGYNTVHLGKYFNNYEGLDDSAVPPGWSTWVSDADDRSTREYYGYNQLRRLPGEPAFLEGPIGSPNYAFKSGIDSSRCKPWRAAGCNYHSDRLSRLALDSISSDGPFYIQMDFHAPHGDSVWPSGAQPATRHMNLARRATLPGEERGYTGNFNEKSVLDKPRQLQRPSLRWWERQRLRSFWRRSIESLRAVDEGMRVIYNTLQKRGLLQNTYIVFLSDNGIFLGEHRLVLGKGLPYQETSNLPAWIRGPGFPGGRSEAPVSGIDWAPTFVELAGISPEGLRFDGQSVFGSLQSSPWRPQLISAPTWGDLSGDKFPEGEALAPQSGSGARFRALRVGPYKYIRYWDGGAELYNLHLDPEEEYNQITTPGYRDLALWMDARVQSLRSCQGPICNTALEPPTPHSWSRDVDAGTLPALLPK